MSKIAAVSYNTNHILYAGKRRPVNGWKYTEDASENDTERQAASASCEEKELQQRMEQEAAKGYRQRLALYGQEQKEATKGSVKAGSRETAEECPAADGEPAAGSARDVEEESESETEILVKPDGTRILVTKLKIGGMVTTMSLKISEPTDLPNDAKWTKGNSSDTEAETASEGERSAGESEVQAGTESEMQAGAE